MNFMYVVLPRSDGEVHEKARGHFLTYWNLHAFKWLQSWKSWKDSRKAKLEAGEKQI